MKEYNDKLYQTRDEHGNVKVAPKNVTTNNMKKGFGSTTTGHLFSSYKYQGSPYDQKREQELQEKMTHKAKIIGPFNGEPIPVAHSLPTTRPSTAQASHINDRTTKHSTETKQFRSGHTTTRTKRVSMEPSLSSRSTSSKGTRAVLNPPMKTCGSSCSLI
jgi:hypothetical protein